jgi:hypothetical protein
MYHIFANTPILKSTYAEGGGLFGGAKTKPKTAAGKGDKTEVVIPGISDKLEAFNSLKDEIADREAKLKMIDGEIRELAKEKFLDLYEQNNSNPGSFYIRGDKGGCLMVLPTDAYKGDRATTGLPEGDAERLKELGVGINTDERFYFSNEVLERNKAEIEKLIMGSKKISAVDKENLILKETKNTVEKGTINKLGTFGAKMKEVFSYIGIVFQLKNCGSKMADGGETGGEGEIMRPYSEEEAEAHAMYPYSEHGYGDGGFLNGDLRSDSEKHSGADEVTIKRDFIKGEDSPYILDINDDGYFYANKVDRDKDYETAKSRFKK